MSATNYQHYREPSHAGRYGFEQFPYEQPAPVYAPQPYAHYALMGRQYYAPPPPAHQDAVTGGVCAVLDYDFEIMTKFVAYLAHRLFNRRDTENPRFLSQLKTVLGAVRLPKSSLILACYFLLERYEKNTNLFAAATDDCVYQTTVLSLVLANKANDDHTFTNKSWSDATGLPVRLINGLEASWLELISWRLHATEMERFDELQLQFHKYTDSVNKHQEQLRFQRLQQQQQQQQQQMAQYHYAREPMSPILSDGPGFTSPYSAVGFQSPWSYQQMYASAGFSHGTKAQYEHEYCCSKTGQVQKNQYCSCRYCSVPTGFEWSNRLGTAC